MSGSAWRSAVATLTAAAALAPDASAAVAPACFATSKIARAKRERPRPTPPLAIGDSIMKRSVSQLGRGGWDANARACRSFRDARPMLQLRKRHGTLPRVIVIALGANAPFTLAEIVKVVHTIGPNRRLGLLTARFSGDRPGFGVDAIYQAAERFPRIVRVLDWVTLARGKPAWFDQDGVHLRSKAGIRAYTDLVMSAAAPPQKQM